MKLNGCFNVEIMHCPSAFVTRTLLNTTRPKIAPIAGVGERNHLANQDCCFKSKQAPFHSYMFEIILVDPPRAGLDDITRKAVAKYPYILYISCSPTALHRDLLQVITRVFCLCVSVRTGMQLLICSMGDLFVALRYPRFGPDGNIRPLPVYYQPFGEWCVSA
jgi:hypothetical protein